jgi:hypothetical protein
MRPSKRCSTGGVPAVEHGPALLRAGGEPQVTGRAHLGLHAAGQRRVGRVAEVLDDETDDPPAPPRPQAHRGHVARVAQRADRRRDALTENRVDVRRAVDERLTVLSETSADRATSTIVGRGASSPPFAGTALPRC